MSRFVVVLLSLLACLPFAAQDVEAQKKFAGTWEVKFKDKVICTLRLTVGEPISGETSACSLNIHANGDLQEPDSTQDSDQPAPILNPKLHGDILSFEEKDGDDMIKFEMKLVGDGQAELTILDSPVPMKPIHLTRK
jgi:hypothetical protein